MSQWGLTDDFSLAGNVEEIPGGYAPPTSPAPVAPSYPVASVPSITDPSVFGGLSGLSGGFSPGFAATSPFSSMSGGGFGGLTGLTGGGGGFGTSLGGGGGGLGSLFGGGSGGLGGLFGGGGSGGGLLSPATAGSLLSLLSGTPGGGPLFGLAGGLGGGLGGLIGGGGPNFSTGSAATGGNIGGLIGGLALGPLGAFGGDLIGSLLAGYIGGGLPRMTKTQGFTNALQGSGDPLEAMLGSYLQKHGINQNIPLSTSSHGPGFQPTAVGNVLEFLSGTQMKDVHGNFLTPQGQTGYQHPVSLAMRPLSYLQQLVPNATNLQLSQIQQILPEIERMVGQRGRLPTRGLTGLLQGENTLAQKLQAAETY